MDLIVSAVKSLRSLAKESRERFVNLKSTTLCNYLLENLHFLWKTSI